MGNPPVSNIRPYPLLALKPASVKAGQVIVPVLGGDGEWHGLVATPALWTAVGEAVQAAQAHAARHPVKSAAERADAGLPLPKPSGAIL